MNSRSDVRAWSEDLVLPTYLPNPPDKNPMFFDRRGHQGSSGKLYPMPLTEILGFEKTEHSWEALCIENEYLKVIILPQLGGRVYSIQDKTNGYELIYRQKVIKPALIGIAGPWISGGIEFNWPQHHRPATFLPVEYEIEECADGSKIVWCGDHDPLYRMKGMFGVALHPGKASVELKVRVHNRTRSVQSFLWWTNMAARVHEGYQSFFPPDVTYGTFHALSEYTELPLCKGSFCGVDYARREHGGVPDVEVPKKFVPPSCRHNGPADGLPDYPANDMTWYANLPVATSYFALGSRQDFFGGYDHVAKAGVVYIANHHIAPGMKQFTFGNHEFGYAWDRNLSDEADGPYIELMAGVYSNNQPDFSFLKPGETRSWSQFWYPIQKMGIPTHANLDGAIRLDIGSDLAQIGVCVTSAIPSAQVLFESGDLRMNWHVDLAPGVPFDAQCTLPETAGAKNAVLRVVDADGRTVLEYAPCAQPPPEIPAAPAKILEPDQIAGSEELYLTGLHLQQYRHATRSPVPYWNEALRRDPLDSRCNNALGLWRMRRGEFELAEIHFRNAIGRLTLHNPNPYDGEPYYNLGLCMRYQFDAAAVPDATLYDAAYHAFYKATWSQAWAAASFHALAELDCLRSNWTAALEHLNRVLRLDTDRLGARNLKAVVLRKIGLAEQAHDLVSETLRLDSLDGWARYLAGNTPSSDLQVILDIAFDQARAGLYDEAAQMIEQTIRDHKSVVGGTPTQSWGADPMLRYTLGWLYQRIGNETEAVHLYLDASKQVTDYCFPSRLEEIPVLRAAIRANSDDARAPYYLGCLIYELRRADEAIALWQRSVSLDPSFSIPWRNLGIAYFNVGGNADAARDAYEHAIAADPTDGRLILERDQLWKRCGLNPEERLRALEERLELVHRRDDLCISICALYNQTGQPAKALDVLTSRQFRPWESAEGSALAQYVQSCVAMGRSSLDAGNAAEARRLFEAALATPENLGSAQTVLVNQSDIHYWLGEACAAIGDTESAQRHWKRAAAFEIDLPESDMRRFSEMTYYSGMALQRLGDEEKGQEMLSMLLQKARDREAAKPSSNDVPTSSQIFN